MGTAERAWLREGYRYDGHNSNGGDPCLRRRDVLRHVLCHRAFRVLRSACASGFAPRVLLRCRVRRCGGRVEDLRGLVDRYRTEEGSIESRCAHAARTFDLTRREEEVLALLLKGCTRSEIARELFVSGDTVKTHIRNLYRKTGVTGKDELVQAIGGRGLV